MNTITLHHELLQMKNQTLDELKTERQNLIKKVKTNPTIADFARLANLKGEILIKQVIEDFKHTKKENA